MLYNFRGEYGLAEEMERMYDYTADEALKRERRAMGLDVDEA